MSAMPEHDIVVFGATGFVGKLTAAYLAGAAPAGTKIALGGRSRRSSSARGRSWVVPRPAGRWSSPTVTTRPR